MSADFRRQTRSTVWLAEGPVLARAEANFTRNPGLLPRARLRGHVSIGQWGSAAVDLFAIVIHLPGG
jgi:hypothetical protein